MLFSWISGSRLREQASNCDAGNPCSRIPKPVTIDSNTNHGLAGDGIVEGTLIACERAWRPVEAIEVGDRVLTFDHGLQTVTGVERFLLWTSESDEDLSFEHMLVPAHALGNHVPLRLLPEQKVIVESDAAEAVYGDPFVLLSAGMLEGLRGVTRVRPHNPTEIFAIGFSHEEVIYANGSALLQCPRHDEARQAGPENFLRSETGGVYPKLSRADSQRLVSDLLQQEHEGELWRDQAALSLVDG